MLWVFSGWTGSHSGWIEFELSINYKRHSLLLSIDGLIPFSFYWMPSQSSNRSLETIIHIPNRSKFQCFSLQKRYSTPCALKLFAVFIFQHSFCGKILLQWLLRPTSKRLQNNLLHVRQPLCANHEITITISWEIFLVTALFASLSSAK